MTSIPRTSPPSPRRIAPSGARGGLRRRWLMVLLWLLLPFLLFVWVSAFGLTTFWKKATENNLRALVHFQTAQVKTFLLEQQRFQQALLSSLSLGKQTLLPASAPSTKPARAASRHNAVLLKWLRFHKRQGKFRGLGLRDEHGRWLGVVGTSLQERPPRTVPAVKGRQILHFSTARETLMRSAFPLKTPSGERVWLWVDAHFRIHQRFLQERKAPAFRGMILLLDSRRRLLCGSLNIPVAAHKHHHDRGHAHHFGKRVTLPSFGPTKRSPRWGKVHTYFNAEGKETLGIGLPLPARDWIVWVELPASLAYKELREWQTQTLIAAVFVLFLLVLLVLWKTRQMSEPLEQLLAATETLRHRNFSALPLSVPEPPEDELEALTLAFSEMGEELRYLYEHLESEVERRTLALHEAQNFSELLFESIPESILVMDRELRVVKANPSSERLFGKELVGQLCHQLLDGPEASLEHSEAYQVLLTEKPRSQEDTQLHPLHGEWLTRDCFPIRDAGGDVIGVLASIKTITRQKQLTAQAIHREKMAALGLLASGVAHEIGNPLASISALLQRLERRAGGASEREPYRELLERTDRISRILGTLSGYARKKSDQRTPLDVNGEVEKAIELMQFDRRVKTAQIVFTKGPNLPLVWAPEDALSQIVTNLLLNSLDATEGATEPTIQIRTWATSDGVRLRIEDNGRGVTETLRERIFEPFFTTKPEKRGTGLGLSICRTLAESMNGQLSLLTREVGTAFEFSAPATVESSTTDGDKP